ncbi:MAG: HAMP domain-containing sensor histidine kinase [Puia sp.]|nr:HAMP domain-containing sensor histidine kinase [Puia sp.]
MKIKDRLSLQFTLIFAILLLCVMVSIYYLTENNRERNFFTHLRERALTAAQIFLAEDNLSAGKFKEVQKRYSNSLPEEELKIYNAQGESVFINQTETDWPPQKIQEVIRKKEIAFYNGGKQVVGIYYMDNSGNFVVFAAARDLYEYKHMQQLLMIMLFLFVISLGIVFFLGQWFSKLALSPINRIIEEIKFIRSSSLDKRLNTGNGKDEIADLSMNVNNLLEHLEQSFSSQRSFVANASHELRTPLTSVIGQIEVTLRNVRASEEYRKVLENLLVETVRINELINSLFELVNANIDTEDFNEVRLDELVWQVKDEWENRLPGSRVELSLSLPQNPAAYTIQGNWHLLFIAIGNIVKNAIKFSTRAPVSLTIGLEGGNVLVAIADKGIGILPEELGGIFQPFYRGSNTGGYEGMGIGLSLSEKILRLHDASIHVHSIPGEGTVFSIKFRMN